MKPWTLTSIALEKIFDFGGSYFKSDRLYDGYADARVCTAMPIDNP